MIFQRIIVFQARKSEIFDDAISMPSSIENLYLVSRKTKNHLTKIVKFFPSSLSSSLCFFHLRFWKPSGLFVLRLGLFLMRLKRYRNPSSLIWACLSLILQPYTRLNLQTKVGNLNQSNKKMVDSQLLKSFPIYPTAIDEVCLTDF